MVIIAMKILRMLLPVIATILVACSDETDCFIADSIHPVKVVDIGGSEYSIYLRVSGFHEKESFYELYEGRPVFNACGESDSLAIFEEPFDSSLGTVSKLVVGGKRLRVVYSKNGPQDIDLKNVPVEIGEIGCLTVSSVYPVKVVDIDGSEYSIHLRVTEFHDKASVYGLYEGKPVFDACGESDRLAIAGEVVDPSLGAVSKLIVDREILRIVYAENGYQGIDMKNVPVEIGEIGCLIVSSIYPVKVVDIDGSEYSIYLRVTGVHDKVSLYELYEGEPMFDACGRSDSLVISRGVVSLSSGAVSKLVVEGKRLRIVYAENGYQGIDLENVPVEIESLTNPLSRR